MLSKQYPNLVALQTTGVPQLEYMNLAGQTAGGYNVLCRVGDPNCSNPYTKK